MFGEVFNTNYWTSGGGNAGVAGAGVQAQAPEAGGSPILPAMWWLGGLLALVIIRVAYELMD